MGIVCTERSHTRADPRTRIQGRTPSIRGSRRACPRSRKQVRSPCGQRRQRLVLARGSKQGIPRGWNPKGACPHPRKRAAVWSLPEEIDRGLRPHGAKSPQWCLSSPEEASEPVLARGSRQGTLCTKWGHPKEKREKEACPRTRKQAWVPCERNRAKAYPRTRKQAGDSVRTESKGLVLARGSKQA